MTFVLVNCRTHNNSCTYTHTHHPSLPLSSVVKDIEISAPGKFRHQISVSVDDRLGFVVATQRADGNLGRKRSLAKRGLIENDLSGVEKFLRSKVCDRVSFRVDVFART